MENLGWGLQMTVLGMGLVFALLALLWVLLTLVLKLDKEEEVPVSALEAQDEAENIAARADDAVVAAIMIATIKHKATLRGQAAPLMRTTWPGTQPSRWSAAGRVRQTNTWNPRGR